MSSCFIKDTLFWATKCEHLQPKGGYKFTLEVLSSKVAHEFAEQRVLTEIAMPTYGRKWPGLVAHTSKPLLILSDSRLIFVLDARSGGVWQTISLHTPSEELSFVSVFADTMIVISRTTNTNTSGEKECFYSHSLL